MGCIAGMMLVNIYFMVKEILRRTKPEFAEIEVEEPKMPEFAKKPKKDEDIPVEDDLVPEEKPINRTN